MDKPFKIEAFYDGDCPLCSREVKFLKRRDRAGSIRFTNIADPQFSAESYGKSFDELMAEMHGRLPSGEWVKGVEVFRRLYAAIGFRWLVWLTRTPVISQFIELTYRIFAKNRLRLTRRCETSSGSCLIDAKHSEVAQ